MTFPELERITFDSAVMGGKPCIRGMRVTVGTILGLIASGADRVEILRLYPYLEDEDIVAALAYGSWRAEERELPMTAGALVTIDPRRMRVTLLPLKKSEQAPSGDGKKPPS